MKRKAVNGSGGTAQGGLGDGEIASPDQGDEQHPESCEVERRPAGQRGSRTVRRLGGSVDMAAKE